MPGRCSSITYRQTLFQLTNSHGACDGESRVVRCWEGALSVGQCARRGHGWSWDRGLGALGAAGHGGSGPGVWEGGPEGTGGAAGSWGARGLGVGGEREAGAWAGTGLGSLPGDTGAGQWAGPEDDWGSPRGPHDPKQRRAEA